MAAHVRLWKYRVAPGMTADFIRNYSKHGSWAKLFGSAPGYLGSELWQDSKDPAIFYTADHWQDATAFEAFEADEGARYRALDTELEGLTTEQWFLGAGNTARSDT